MSIGDERIITQVMSAPEIGPDMQPVFVGHCASANPSALVQDPQLLHRLQEMGYAERIAGFAADEGLYHLPLPIRSLAQFQQLFPASQETAAIASTPAVAFAQYAQENWLPWAIHDFFRAGLEQTDERICWVIRVPRAADENAHDVDAFDVNPAAVQHASETWHAVELACSIESAGILVMPDFEKQLLPPDQGDVARVRLPNPDPMFRPCSSTLDDGHRERRYSTEMPTAKALEDATRRITRIAQRIQAWRPDMQWLLSLPAQVEQDIALARPLDAINTWLQGEAKQLAALAHVQFIFPLVYNDQRSLSSASGLIAGHIVHKTQTEGVWRSVAGMPLADNLKLWPQPGRKDRTLLREQLGIGVLCLEGDNLQLDDERLAVQGFCQQAGSACQSGELMRFVGWLRRSLRDLGEDMIFQLDGRDPVVRNILDAFFAELHHKGALRGAQAEDAYRLTNLSQAANQILYQIEIAPSFPVDRFVVTFMHDRAANSPVSRLEVANA